MKNKSFTIVVAVISVIFLVLLSNPFMFWMPSRVEMMVLLGAVVLICLWAGFVVFEQATDERELIHRMNSGRVAYLSALVVLTAALIIQGLHHAIDAWIALTLIVVILAKLISRLYFDQVQ